MQIADFDAAAHALEPWRLREVRVTEAVSGGIDTVSARGIFYPTMRFSEGSRILELSVNLIYNVHHTFKMWEEAFSFLLLQEERVVAVGAYGSLTVRPAEEAADYWIR